MKYIEAFDRVLKTADAMATRLQAAEKRIAELEARPLPERGEKGERGEPGPGIKGAIRDHDGVLFFTLSDGSMIECGQVTSKPFTLDDFDIQPIDERTIKMGFTRGDVMHSFELTFPVMIYRGVYREGEAYERGDTVTWGGSLWHCDKDTTGKPDSGDWTLCAKRGRDGRDGKDRDGKDKD